MSGSQIHSKRLSRTALERTSHRPCKPLLVRLRAVERYLPLMGGWTPAGFPAYGHPRKRTVPGPSASAGCSPGPLPTGSRPPGYSLPSCRRRTLGEGPWSPCSGRRESRLPVGPCELVTRLSAVLVFDILQGCHMDRGPSVRYTLTPSSETTLELDTLSAGLRHGAGNKGEPLHHMSSQSLS